MNGRKHITECQQLTREIEAARVGLVSESKQVEEKIQGIFQQMADQSTRSTTRPRVLENRESAPEAAIPSREAGETAKAFQKASKDCKKVFSNLSDYVADNTKLWPPRTWAQVLTRLWNDKDKRLRALLEEFQIDVASHLSTGICTLHYLKESLIKICRITSERRGLGLFFKKRHNVTIDQTTHGVTKSFRLLIGAINSWEAGQKIVQDMRE